ncbi:MAG: type VI secretion system ATPase TssH, partial [Candidatus Enteromonas sp.]|nr:type VI secretion system ATPase TssH [Candidatus Enteromonas sp.]
IIMTSNLGSEYILSGNKAPVEQLLHNTFKPEFLNRIDEIVYFNPLSRDVQKAIVAKMLKELKKRLSGQYFDFEWTDALKEAILDAAYSPEFGARPLKRYIQDKVETPIAEKIIKGEVEPEKPYVVDSDSNGGIVVSPRALTA